MTTRLSPVGPLTVRGEDEPAWVTKTNLTDYIRCARTYWLIAQGRITHEQSINPALLSVVEHGVEFESSVRADAEVDQAGEDVVWRCGGQPPLMLNTELYGNTELGISGIPDGVDTETGLWAPVEVKSHRRSTALDRIELAFYWLLLAPFRERRAAPHGYLVLPVPSAEPRVERVGLRTEDLTRVKRFLPEVRRARSSEPPLAFCRCYVCTILVPSNADRELLGTSDLSLLFGLGHHRRREFEAVGITRYDVLADSTVDAVMDRFDGGRRSFGRSDVEGWIAHATSYRDHRHVIFRDASPMPDDYISLDLEYERTGFVWAAGVKRRGAEIAQFWAETDAEERALLHGIGEFLAAHPGVPVATYWGVGADIPTIKRAAERHGIESPLAGVEQFDLCWWFMRHLRLPTPCLGLKQVSDYFGVVRTEASVGSGSQACGVYAEAVRRSGTARGRTLKRQLLAYNADDVAAIEDLIEMLRDMYVPIPVKPADPPKRPKAPKPGRGPRRHATGPRGAPRSTATGDRPGLRRLRPAGHAEERQRAGSDLFGLHGPPAPRTVPVVSPARAARRPHQRRAALVQPVLRRRGR